MKTTRIERETIKPALKQYERKKFETAITNCEAKKSFAKFEFCSKISDDHVRV